MNLVDLVILKNDLFEKVNDADFLRSFTDELQADDVFWARGPLFTIIPFELEMSGVKPARALSKECQDKKTLQKITY